jgi:hypothetical protein
MLSQHETRREVVKKAPTIAKCTDRRLPIARCLSSTAEFAATLGDRR